MSITNCSSGSDLSHCCWECLSRSQNQLTTIIKHTLAVSTDTVKLLVLIQDHWHRNQLILITDTDWYRKQYWVCIDTRTTWVLIPRSARMIITTLASIRRKETPKQLRLAPRPCDVAIVDGIKADAQRLQPRFAINISIFCADCCLWSKPSLRCCYDKSQMFAASRSDELMLFTARHSAQQRMWATACIPDKMKYVYPNTNIVVWMIRKTLKVQSWSPTWLHTRTSKIFESTT